MRVVVVVPWEPWRVSDGIVLPLHHHLHELSGRHDITVLASGSRSSTEQRMTGSAVSLPTGVDLRWFGTSLPGPVDYVVRRLRSEVSREPAHVHYTERPGLLAALEEEAATADVLHLVGWGTARLARRVAPVPAVHYAVDPWASSWGNRRLSHLRRLTDTGERAKIGRHERRYYPDARSVVLVADADAQELRAEMPGLTVDVVPNGVEAGPQPAPAPPGLVIGFHGAFETQANIDAAVAVVEQVLPRVQAQLPEATVLLVGRDPSPEILELAARPGVQLRADVPSIRLELERMAVHVSWMPSGRGQKNKVLEAMAAARPVVVNDRGASGIGAGDGIIVAASFGDAAEEVVRLLRSPAEAAAVGRAGRQRVLREFTWAESAAGMERVWQRVRR